MFTRRYGLIPRVRQGSIIAGFLLCCASAALADPPPQEAALKKHGLVKAGDYFLIADDAQARTKIEEARKASKAWRMAEMRKASTASVQDFQNYLKQLSAEVAGYKTQINAANAQINAASRGRRGFSNSMVVEARNEMTAYRNELQLEMNQLNQTISQLKSHPVKPEDKARAEGEARDLREALEKAVKDARESVDAATKKYEELGGDADVKKQLEQLGVGVKMKPKLGPSRGFVTQVKVLEKLEREIESPAAAAPATKHKRAGTTKSLKKARTTPPPSGL